MPLLPTLIFFCALGVLGWFGRTVNEAKAHEPTCEVTCEEQDGCREECWRP